MKYIIKFKPISDSFMMALLLLFATGSYCEAQSWQWAASMGNAGAAPSPAPDEKVNDMAIDQWGNVYAIGEIWQGGLIGGQPVPYWGIFSTGFVAKYNCHGDFVWAKTFGSLIQPAYGSQIEIDPSGNIFIAGWAVGTSQVSGWELHFFDSTYVGDYADVFIAKIDSGGQVQWVQFAGQNGEIGTNIQDMTIDNQNRLLVLIGSAPGEVYPGHFCPIRGTYVFKFDTLGNVLSSGFLTELIQGGWYWSTAVDQLSNMYLSLRFEDDTLLFGGQQIIKQGTAQADLLFIKVDSSLNYQWHVDMGDSLYYGIGYGVQTDSLNNAYFTGWVPDGRSLQGHVFTNPNGIVNAHVTFIAKFSTSGTLIWADNVIAQYGALGDGRLIRQSNGDLYFSGVFGGVAQFGSTNLTAVNFRDFYLCKVGPNGLIQSATTFTTTGTMPYPAITQVDNVGNVYVGGGFDGTITINGVTQTNQGGYSNGFIAKYGFPCTTGLDEEQLSGNMNTVHLFPNPVSEVLTVSVPETFRNGIIQVTDILGRTMPLKAIMDAAISQSVIDVSNLRPGIYFITVRNADSMLSEKFIKQ